MAEEVDLVGLDKQLKDIQIHINELSDGLGTMQSRLKGLMSIDVANNTKAFDSALKSLAVSASEIKSKLSSGDSAVRDFIKLFQQLGELKSVPVLPITGLIETLNNLTESCKAAANEYKNLLNPQVKSTEEERLQQRMNILNGLVNATKMQAEREKRAAENSAFYTRQKNKELEKEAMLRERAVKRQEEINKLIYGINIKGAAAPFKNEALYIRMSAMLDAIKTKQSQCNTETEKGRKEYQEYANQIAKVKSGMSQLGIGTNKLSKAMGKMKGFAEQMALSFGVMTGVFGVTNFFKSLYKITAEFQLQTKALAAIINNAREANILFNQMKSLAIESPMKLMDLNKYAKQLAAFRIETNELYGSLKMLGDISVGVGVDMDRLILAYGQVKAANYLRGQELRQFSEAGVNILGGLKEYYRETKNLNLSINDIFDSISKRKVLFEDVDAVLKKMTASGGEFYNMQLIQSQTLYGQIQKLGDMFQIEMNNVGKSVSGTMLSLIKLVQFVIKNLRSVVTILMTLGAAKFMTKLIFTFSTLNAESTKLRISVLRTAASFRRLGASKFSSMAAGIASSAKAMGLLGGAITGAALAAGLLIAKISEARAKQKQFEEDMANEFGEYIKRFHEVSEIEDRFDASNTYKDRLIALQDLADKAKEYMYTLQLPEKVTAENINEAFANASKELDDYIEKVYEYKSALKTPDVDKELEDWSRVNTEFANASLNAKELFLDYDKNYDNLADAQKKAFDAIKEEREAFLSNEEEASEKYNKTVEQWKRDFVIAINNLDQYYKVMSQYAGYGTGLIQEDEGYFSFPFGDKDAQKFATTRMHNINKFVDTYIKTFDDTKKTIEQRLQYAGIDISQWILLEKSGDKKELEQRIKDMVPAIMDAFKDAPEYFRQNLPDILGDIAGLEDKNIVATVMWQFVHAKSNVADSEFEKFIEEALTFDDSGNTEEGLTKNVTVKIKTQLDDGEGGYKEVEQTINTAMRNSKTITEQMQTNIKTIEDMVMSVANASKNATGGVKERKKAAEDEYKYWVGIKKQIDLAKNSTLQQAVLIKSINKQLGTSFSTLKDIAIVADLALQNGKIWFDINSWELPKDKTHTRMQSMKEEYKSMIDFVRELNTEFDKLRKDFNKDDTEMWRGATNRILTSFEDKFLAMPKKFREAFKNGLKDIDFTTKEGTLAAEEIVKGLIKNAKNITKKEKDELLRAWGEAVGQIKLDIDLNERSLEKERLKYRVQKMFDDYNLTLELGKLGVNTDEIADLFNITTRDLGSLQSKLESMREEFMGTDDEKRYREHMRKIVELNEKANLEMAKKYVKYLRQEYDERAKLEIEYMKKRADVYSLPFESDVQSRIIDNLKKEFDEKMSKLNWDTFRGSDAYIDMFEDLGRVSTKALTDMRDKIYELKGSLTGLKPSDMKTMVEAIRKLDDEVIRRNPFKAIVESMREIKKMKMDETLAGKIKTYLGDNAGLSFRKNIENALNEARNILQQKKQSIWDIQVGIDAKNTIKNAQDWLNKNLPKLQDKLKVPISPYVENIDKLESKMRELGKDIDTERLKGLTSDAGLSEAEQKWLALYNIVKRLSDIKASKETEEKLGFGEESVEQLKQTLKELGIEIKITEDDVKDFADAWEQVNNKKKGIKQFAEDSAKSLGELKGALSSLMENLDYFGGTTDDLTEAWKEFGETIFDTIINALEMIPSLVSGFTAAGVAINSAMGIVGLIAEAVQLVITLVSALGKLHDAKIQKQLDGYEKQINKLKRSYEDLSEVFSDLYNTDDLVEYSNKSIIALKLQLEQYKAALNAMNGLKKKNEAEMEEYTNAIEDIQKKIREQSENIKESLGGFGSMANMKSMAQEWSDAWYDAFKETGDGLSGLEDSFDEFLDNLYKRQILNALGKKYFEGLFKDLDNLLLKEGGLAENRYEFSQWADRMRDAMGAFSEEAKDYTEILSSAGGLGSNLEGLQASIQGMTETTAQALEGYLNAIRLYVAEDNERLAAIANSLLSTTTTNPMLEQLRMIAANTSAMQTLLDSVVQPSGYQGANGSGRPYIRVHAHMD